MNISNSQRHHPHTRHRTHVRHTGEPPRGEAKKSEKMGESQRADQRRSSRRKAASRSRSHARGGTSNGKAASALCVMAAFFAFGTLLIAELIAHLHHEPPNAFLNGFAGFFALAGVATGGYAQTVQLRRWSRRVRNRLLIGLPIAALTLVLTIKNVYHVQVPIERPMPTELLLVEPEDRGLFKPGWYGEAQQDGVMAVLSSFAENAAESRRFNRQVTQPLSYATLTVVNLGGPTPVVLNSVRVGLLLESGEEVQSLAVRPLLGAAASAEELKRRLSEPQTLAVGAMVPDIPVCLDAGFHWERVRGIKVTFKDRVLMIPGRMITAEEKRALLESSGTVHGKGSPAATNLSAEAWFKDL